MVPLLPINQLSPPDSAFFLPPLLNLQAIRLVTLFVTCFFCHQLNECNKFCSSFKRRFHILTRPPLLLQRKVWQQQAKMVQKIVIKSRLCCILFLRYAQTAFIKQCERQVNLITPFSSDVNVLQLVLHVGEQKALGWLRAYTLAVASLTNVKISTCVLLHSTLHPPSFLAQVEVSYLPLCGRSPYFCIQC